MRRAPATPRVRRAPAVKLARPSPWAPSSETTPRALSGRSGRTSAAVTRTFSAWGCTPPRQVTSTWPTVRSQRVQPVCPGVRRRHEQRDGPLLLSAKRYLHGQLRELVDARVLERDSGEREAHRGHHQRDYRNAGPERQVPDLEQWQLERLQHLLRRRTRVRHGRDDELFGLRQRRRWQWRVLLRAVQRLRRQRGVRRDPQLRQHLRDWRQHLHPELRYHTCERRLELQRLDRLPVGATANANGACGIACQ